MDNTQIKKDLNNFRKKLEIMPDRFMNEMELFKDAVKLIEYQEKVIDRYEDQHKIKNLLGEWRNEKNGGLKWEEKL